MRSLGLQPTDAELQDMINEVDADSDGTIDFEEFVKLMTREVDASDSGNELYKAFQVFDKDNSGSISASELKEVLISIGERVTDAEVDAMMEEADVDHNGTISCTLIQTVT